MSRDPRAPFWRRWSRPLRLHLSIVIVILLMLIAGPLMWLSHEQGVRLSTAAATQQMRLLGRRAAERYETVLGDGFSAASTLAAALAFRSGVPDDLDAKTRLLRAALNGSSFIDSVYAGYPDGSFIQLVGVAGNPDWAKAMSMPDGTAYALRVLQATPEGSQVVWHYLDRDWVLIADRPSAPTNYDPRRRPWYRDAVRGTEPVAVGPYVMATTKTLGITVAAPMGDDSEVVVGADVMIETLGRLLSREAVSASAVGYVFDAQGRLVIHSDPRQMERLTHLLLSSGRAGDEALDDLVLNQVRVVLAGGGQAEDTATLRVAGAPYIAQISRIERGRLGGGETIVIAAPLSDFTGDSDLLLRKSLLISGLLLAAGIVAGLLISRLIGESLTQLTDHARRMGDLEFGERTNVRSYITEINALARALDTARGAILTFAVFVPRELVRRIVASGQSAVGSADRLDVTVLFTDIQDFTTISEDSRPEEVVQMLSAYFQVMNEVVEQHRGVILQYLGDAIHAIWNAPLPNPGHADDACRCALALKAAIDALNAANRAAGRPELVTRFGLHSGEAVVGTVGARSRLQYTAMGDTVNVASRIEGANKLFGTSILVSRAVVDRAGSAHRFRPLGFTQVKGRQGAIELFELVAADDAAPDASENSSDQGA